MERVSAQNESSERKEYIPSSEAVCSFLNVSPEVLASFKNRLQGAQGHLRIWVHPLFTEQVPTSANDRLGDATLPEVQEKLRDGFLRTVESVVKNQQSSPMIVYEVAKEVTSTKVTVAQHVGCDSSELERLGIIFIPTDSSTAALAVPHLIQSLQSGDIDDAAEAEKLAEFIAALDSWLAWYKENRQTKEIYETAPDEIFAAVEAARKKILDEKAFIIFVYQSLGLESAVVAGAYMDITNHHSTGEPYLDACAGSVATMLRKAGFPVDISKNIWPPKELIREAGLEVKQTKGHSDSLSDPSE